MSKYVPPNRYRTGSVPLMKFKWLIVFSVILAIGLTGLIFWALYSV